MDRLRAGAVSGLLSSMADVVLGRSCAGCDAPGIALCQECRHALRARPRLRRSVDLGDIEGGLHLPVACALEYRGAVRQVLYRFKDHRIPHLARPLAPALAASIAFAAEHAGIECARTTLVVMPTRRSTAKRRGFDPLGSVVAGAIREQRVAGVRTPLVDIRRAGTSKTLGVWERQLATAGAFAVRGHARGHARGRSRSHSRGSGLLPDGPVILVDDIVTTGATAREAAATLIVAGVHVVAVATIAGTP